MPIYEYECIEKKHRFEELQKISDRPLTTCKVCGGKVKKLISATAFQLKGGGWYKDGYSSGNGSKSKSGASEPCSGCDSKCDLKPKKSK
jgi:putative FmdB family regulatory protein